MVDEMDFSNRELRFLLIAGIVLGILLTIVVNNEPVLILFSILTNGELPHNVYVMNYERGSCDFYMPEKYLPAAAPQIQEQYGYECSDIYNSFVIEKQIQLINNSSYQSGEVAKALERAKLSLEEGNLKQARSNLSRISSNKTYYVE